MNEAKEFANNYNMQFLETSAKNSINIQDIFIEASKSYIIKQELAHKYNSNNNNKLKNDLQEDKRITTLVSKKKNSMFIDVDGSRKNNEECCK